MSSFGIGAGLGLGFPLGIEVLASPLFTAAAPIGMLGISYIACRAIYRGIVKRRKKRIADLFDRIVSEATASIASATLNP